jgi:putative spermidine/putrescine transport system substrate-binding protein
MDERAQTFQRDGGISRRRFVQAAGAAAILAAEGSLVRRATAEDRFTIASTGGSWGEGIKTSFVVKPEFEKRYKTSVTYAHQLESVAASKILASCGTPVFSVSTHGQAEAVLLAEAGCVQPYKLDVVQNFRDIPANLTLERAGLGPYYGAYVFLMWALTWNTKHARRPASYKDLWSSAYRGKIAVPAYGWYGIYWLHAVNKLFGGTEDNITPGMQAVAELVQKNGAIIMENVDHGMKLFQREEIVMAPFWNGRTFALQDGGTPVAIEYVPASISLGAGFVIVKGTALDEIAQRFVNETLDERNQLEMTRLFKYPPASRRAKLPPELERVRVPEAELAQTARLDWKKINDHRSAYLDRWNKEVLGKG